MSRDVPVVRLTLMFFYQVVAMGTGVFLIFYDGYEYNWWNWLVAVPVSLFLAEIWPLYWGLLRWVV